MVEIEFVETAQLLKWLCPECKVKYASVKKSSWDTMNERDRQVWTEWLKGLAEEHVREAHGPKQSTEG